MVSLSSSFKILASFSIPVGEKPSKSNYFLWQAQVLTSIKGAQLKGLLDGSSLAPPLEIVEKVADKEVKKPNLEHARWVA
jgi:hypothetical protein